MAKGRAKRPRTTLAQRLDAAASRGYSDGYARGVQHTEEKLNARQLEVRRVELAEKILRDHGQAWESVAMALRAALGVL